MSEGTDVPAAAPPAAPDVAVLDLAKALPYSDNFLSLARPIVEGEMSAATDKNPKLRFGVTRKLLGDALARKGAATVEELRELTKERAYKILYERIWEPLEGDKLGLEVASALFGVAYKRDVETAGRLVQFALPQVADVDLKRDGRMVGATIGAIAELVTEGRGLALAEQVMKKRDTFWYRVWHGRVAGGDISLIRAAGFIAKAALASQTGLKLP